MRCAFSRVLTVSRRSSVHLVSRLCLMSNAIGPFARAVCVKFLSAVLLFHLHGCFFLLVCFLNALLFPVSACFALFSSFVCVRFALHIALLSPLFLCAPLCCSFLAIFWFLRCFLCLAAFVSRFRLIMLSRRPMFTTAASDSARPHRAAHNA